jgi:bla regulator protein BlaR1
MPDLFVNLIKVNIALVLFCLGYYVVLRKLTFYTLNRAYLVAAIIFSSIYPFIDLSVFAQRHQQIVAPVQNIVIEWKAPAESLIKQAAYWNWLEALFWTGVVILAMRLMSQLFSLYSIYRRSDKRIINGKNVRVVSGDISPFSFWKSIYVNPENLCETDLHNILEHEQIHVNEWHTLDILLTEISVIFYWFNPGIWMIKRAVRENIEFITDRKILQKGTDSRAYQYSLLNITFNQSAPAVTSNFNFSTLKKRIKMMNAKRSSKITLTRYALILPVVMVSLFTFSLSNAAVVKTSSAFKTVAAAVKKINGIVLNSDTVPATRTITGTVTIIKGNKGKTTKVITLNGADVNHLTLKIDSPAVERHTVTITGKRPGQIDSVITISMVGGGVGKNVGQFNSNGVTGISFNDDNANTYKGERAKLTFSSAVTVDTTNHQFIYKNGDAKLTTTTLSSNNNVVISVPPNTTLNLNKENHITIAPIRTITGNNNNVVITGQAHTNNTDKLQPITVEGKKIPNTGVYHIVSNVTGSQIAANQPLFMVDGKEVNQKELKSFEGNVVYLSPDTATEKYGTKGKNGAIVITTKNGKK